MSDEKFGNTNSSRGMSDTDKGYYEDLYNDLPKEVVDILMQTHPLMGKNDDAEATAYRTRRPQRREDVEEVREARMQQVGSEINEVSKAPQQEGEPTRYVSRRARNSGITSEDMGNAHTSAPTGNRMDQDDYDDGIQYVSVIPARKKSKIVEEVTLQTTAAPQKRGRKSKKEPMPFEDMGRDSRDNRPRYEDIDFEERAKQEHLDSLYDDDYDDDYGKGGSKLPIILGVVAVILIIFLIFRTVSLDSKLEEAENKLTQSEEYKTKYEDLQLEKMQLEEKLNALENPSENNGNNEENNGDEENNGGSNTSTPASNTTSSTTEYTVQEGDTAWKIAQKTLGNGAEYKKILDANGLKESDNLKIGAKLKIPK